LFVPLLYLGLFAVECVLAADIRCIGIHAIGSDVRRGPDAFGWTVTEALAHIVPLFVLPQPSGDVASRATVLKER
jgi:hypothetical protein